jgi:hypothetical protein
MNLDELRALLYPRTKTIKELKPTKTCKSSTISADDHTLPERTYYGRVASNQFGRTSESIVSKNNNHGRVEMPKGQCEI